jgi:hypothetical protein
VLLGTDGIGTAHLIGITSLGLGFVKNKVFNKGSVGYHIPKFSLVNSSYNDVREKVVCANE